MERGHIMKFCRWGVGLLLLAASTAAGPAAAGGGLRVGEYACYGAGGELLAGLGFKVLDASHYNDLDGNTPGTFAINGDMVAFHGGSLDGQMGRDLKDQKFTLGSGIGCEPFS